MGDYRLYAAIEWKRGAMPYPRLSSIWTMPYSPAGRPKTYTVVCRHTLPPFMWTPVSSQAEKIVLCLHSHDKQVRHYRPKQGSAQTKVPTPAVRVARIILRIANQDG